MNRADSSQISDPQAAARVWATVDRGDHPSRAVGALRQPELRGLHLRPGWQLPGQPDVGQCCWTTSGCGERGVAAGSRRSLAAIRSSCDQASSPFWLPGRHSGDCGAWYGRRRSRARTLSPQGENMKRSRWPSRKRSYARTVAALAAAGCAALSLVMAGGAVASGSVAAGPNSVAAGAPLASRFAALRLRAGWSGPRRALAGGTSHQRGSCRSRPPGRVCGARRQPGRPGSQHQDRYRVRADPVHDQLLLLTPEHVVDIINAAKCNAKVLSGCRVVARATVGSAPLAAAIDPADRHRLRDQRQRSNTVSVLNGARCNARVTRGCLAGGDGQGGEVAGRRGRQPGHAHAVCGERWRAAASR